MRGGRSWLRIELAGWTGESPRALAAEVERLPGVTDAGATPSTRRLLVRFDPRATDAPSLLRGIAGLPPVDAAAADETQPKGRDEGGPRAIVSASNGRARARISVRGLDREPALAGEVVARLSSLPGVSYVSASPLTGRALVEYSAAETKVADLVAEVAGIELPALPGEDRPRHPLDPEPLWQNGSRLAGAALGLTLLAARRTVGATGPPTAAAGPAEAAALLGVVEGFPALRGGVERVLGDRGTELTFAALAVTTLTLSGSGLGLAVSGLGALRAFTEVRARQRAWRRYEQRAEHFAPAVPGAETRVESGERVPLPGEVVEGYGTAATADGVLAAVRPGDRVEAGMRVHGDSFVVALGADDGFVPEPRASPPRPTILDRYVEGLPWAALGYAALTAVATRSLRQAFSAFVVVNPRAALASAQAADLGAAARVLRGGVTVASTRERGVLRPSHVLLDSSRPLVDGYELTSVTPVGALDAREALDLASRVAAAAESPWPRAFAPAAADGGAGATFDGETASATVRGVRYSLGPDDESDPGPGEIALVLRVAARGDPVARMTLSPRPARGLSRLVETARRGRCELAVVARGEGARVAGRLGLDAVDADPLEAIRERQRDGGLVLFASDRASAGAAFAASDLAVGLASGRSGRFAARADLLAPDLGGLAAIVDAGVRREAAVRDGVALALAANVVGAAWALGARPTLQRAVRPLYFAALAGFADGAVRLRGGVRAGSLASLADPRPERWGRQAPEDVLRAFETRADGLTHAEAGRRRRDVNGRRDENRVAAAVADQLRSPLTALLAVGAALSYAVGAAADAGVIAAVVALNSAVGAWQEAGAGAAADALERRSRSSARVRRGGQLEVVSAADVVPGDVLVLAPGDRVAADARLLASHRLEVDEAALTGESLPVTKQALDGSPESRVLLAGSDVTVGSGEAVVVAVGPDTRMGATAAALELGDEEASGIDRRLSAMLREALPISLVGGALVVAAGLAWRRPVRPQLAVGASVAIAALPEGLPLLAGVAEAAVARRLARHEGLVRRLGAVEALGRVDVACVDKTGTLTTGRLAVTRVADLDHDAAPAAGATAGPLRGVLLAAALASPHPESVDASAHPTDRAVTEAAEAAGLGEPIRAPRSHEAPFDPARAFHAAVADGRLYVKGAAEVMLHRCASVRRRGEDRPLDAEGRAGLAARAEELAARGLRVLLVAEGAAARADDPDELMALGFVGIADPLRAGVATAVARCRQAGVRVLMLTGDHPATALAIARDAGIAQSPDDVLSREQLSEDALEAALERASVVARVTPLDKVLIIESLQRRGHAVAMTGDGVNDAPALRLADVGVAMGAAGTDVAREAADIVLADDNFATLVEALVEGRGFWRNMRRALGLLLGGNLGEIGLIVAATVLGQPTPLTARQVLAVNVVTDVLPAVAIAVQAPEHRDLSALAREGLAALDAPLRRDVARRGLATAAPSLAAFAVMRARGDVAAARTTAFVSVVATQLVQTAQLGRAEGRTSRSVSAAVAASAAVTAAATAVGPLRAFLGLTSPGAAGAGAVAAASLAAGVLGRPRA